MKFILFNTLSFALPPSYNHVAFWYNIHTCAESSSNPFPSQKSE
jgi:hypothetical protein